MPSIGIIANPASGKDIRRLVSYATTVDNQEKVNIVKRIIMAAQCIGIDRIWLMPDSFHIGGIAVEGLKLDGTLKADCRLLDMPMSASTEDTILAARKMEELRCGCIVVLGGDGTSRAASKGMERTPLLPISTGTNNVYPYMMEGTVAGMAAAVVALSDNPYETCLRDKRIEIFRNEEFLDVALIDAVLSEDLWIGSRAIWDARKIRQIIVTRSHPASIGFSALAGCLEVIRDLDDFGLALTLGKTESREQKGQCFIAPIGAGLLTAVDVLCSHRLSLRQPYSITAEEDCMLALDGERELRFRKGDQMTFVLTRQGPWRVLIRKTLEKATERGIFCFEL